MSVRRLDPIQPKSFRFSPENLKWAKGFIKNYPPGKQASAIIPLLWRAHEQEGWLTRPAMEYVGRMLDMSFIRVYEVATFYTMFHLSPVGARAHVQVCGTTPCMLRGAEELIAVCRAKIAPQAHVRSSDGNLSWEEVECLGACVNAPIVQVFKDTYEDLTPEIFGRLIDAFAAGKKPKAGSQSGRQTSAPDGELTSLTDPALYGGKAARAGSARPARPRKGAANETAPAVNAVPAAKAKAQAPATTARQTDATPRAKPPGIKPRVK